jgi:threonine/homoserine/homoserine lactone efflux protein
VPEIYTVVKLAGAGYLAWLAVRTLRPGGVSAFEPAQPRPDSPRRLFTMGLLTNLLNPKIAILYVSLIPQFVRPDRGSLLVQGFLLGGAQIVVAVTVNLLIVAPA